MPSGPKHSQDTMSMTVHTVPARTKRELLAEGPSTLPSAMSSSAAVTPITTATGGSSSSSLLIRRTLPLNQGQMLALNAHQPVRVQDDVMMDLEAHRWRNPRPAFHLRLGPCTWNGDFWAGEYMWLRVHDPLSGTLGLSYLVRLSEVKLRDSVIMRWEADASEAAIYRGEGLQDGSGPLILRVRKTTLSHDLLREFFQFYHPSDTSEWQQRLL